MGRKARRSRHNDDDDDDDDDDGTGTGTGNDSYHSASAAAADVKEESKSTSKSKDLDFRQKRELQRQQAALKRKSKQKCYLCGQTGHVRRECPGIADDGRGMSRYKGKSDPQQEKTNYRAKRYGEGIVESSLDDELQLQYPAGFEKKQQQQQQQQCVVLEQEADDGGKPTSTTTATSTTTISAATMCYYDVHCDVLETIEYLRFGRGKRKISQKEAIQEYRANLEQAADTNIRSIPLGGIISKTIVKSNRPWQNPLPFEPSPTPPSSSDNSLPSLPPIYFVVGLDPSIIISYDTNTDDDDDDEDSSFNEKKEADIQRLVDTVHNNSETVIGIYCALDYRPKTLEQKTGWDQPSQWNRLQCSLEAAGRCNVPIQIRTLPGAADLDPDPDKSVAGTDYAKVLLDLQRALTTIPPPPPTTIGGECLSHTQTQITHTPKIHLVSWSGRANHLLSILQAFPNVKVVGLDGSVSFTKMAHLHECAFEIPLDRLVLETSNVIPSVVANTLGKREACFHSAWWPFVAQAVTKHKQTAFTSAAATTRNQHEDLDHENQKDVDVDDDDDGLLSTVGVARAVAENTLEMYPQLAEAGNSES